MLFYSFSLLSLSSSLSSLSLTPDFHYLVILGGCGSARLWISSWLSGLAVIYSIGVSWIWLWLANLGWIWDFGGCDLGLDLSFSRLDGKFVRCFWLVICRFDF